LYPSLYRLGWRYWLVYVTRPLRLVVEFQYICVYFCSYFSVILTKF
jgi:hypothetical protein